jgi:hypothetical protein
LIKLLFKYLVLFASILVLLVLILSLIYQYKNSLEYGIIFLNAGKYYENIFDLISKDKFTVIQISLGFFGITLLFVFKFFEVIYTNISYYINDLYVSSYSIIKKELSSNTKYILLVPFLSAVYFALHLPVAYDEAWTFLNFTNRGFLVSVLYYPAPNNHILHSVITNITYYIPFLPTLIKLRISPILFSILTIIVGSHFLKKYYSEQISFVVSAIFSTLYMSIYFSCMSRGYSIIFLCFITSLYLAFNIIKEGGKTRDWIWFSFFSILGFYTMPSYLYPYIILNFLILINKVNQIKKQIFAGIYTIIPVFILYFPLIVINGIESLTNNIYVAPKDRMEVWTRLPAFFYYSIDKIFGFAPYIIIFLLAISILLLIRNSNKNQFNLKMSLLFIITPPILLLIHSVIPFSRTFNYYAFILVFLIFLPFEKSLVKIKIKNSIILLIPVQLALVLNFNFNDKVLIDYTIQSKYITSEIMGNYKYLINSSLFDAYLLYELETKYYPNYDVKYYPKVKMNADTISGFDFIIIDNAVDFTVTRMPKYENNYYRVY